MNGRLIAFWMVLMGMLGMPICAFAADEHLPLPTGLDQLSAGEQPKAVAILFSAPNCTYCERVRQQALRYLEKDGRYAGRVKAFEIGQESDQPNVVWFDGRTHSGRQLARLLGVKFSPTVMVFNGKGIVAGEPILGSGLPDFYGAYLDALIQKAWKLPT